MKSAFLYVLSSHRVNKMDLNFHFVVPFRYLNLCLKLVIYTAICVQVCSRPANHDRFFTAQS